MKFKDGVVTEVLRYRNNRPETIRMSASITDAMRKIDEVSQRLTGLEVVITSALDGKHMANSLHYQGKAIDIRTRIYTKSQVAMIVDKLFEVLGDEYDIIDEGDHIHIEYEGDSFP